MKVLKKLIVIPIAILIYLLAIPIQIIIVSLDAIISLLRDCCLFVIDVIEA